MSTHSTPGTGPGIGTGTGTGSAAVPGPSPAAAPPAQRIGAQARFELRNLLGNGEQLLLTVVIPLVVLGLMTFTGIAGSTKAERLDQAVPAVLTLVVLSTAFTSLAIGTGFDRRYGVLKHLGSTPLGSGGLLAAKALAVAVIELAQALLIVVVALLLGWSGPGSALGWLVTAVFMVLGTVALGALGFWLAGVLRAEAVLAVANAVFLVLLGAGGIAVPLDRLPSGWAAIARLLPTGAMAEGIGGALADPLQVAFSALIVLAIWAVGGTLLAVRFFRWD